MSCAAVAGEVHLDCWESSKKLSTSFFFSWLVGLKNLTKVGLSLIRTKNRQTPGTPFYCSFKLSEGCKVSLGVFFRLVVVGTVVLRNRAERAAPTRIITTSGQRMLVKLSTSLLQLLREMRAQWRVL
jgi:hypothetical protein